MNKLSTSIFFIACFILSVVIYLSFFRYNQEKPIDIPKNVPMMMTPTISPTITSIPTLEPTPISSQYRIKKHIYATMFWVGEKATEENDYIPNQSSAWDVNWLDRFGGIDNPYARNGYHPKGFTPKENPFYFALPYNEFNASGRKASAVSIPWYIAVGENVSLLKNRWIKVIHKNEICYGQWEDVGPFEDDDFEYVFGTASPKEQRAGIDLSPAMRTCLKMVTNDNVDWQFIEEEDVPAGPWKDIVTQSQTNW